MSSATFAVQDSPLDRLILAIGTRMMPRHLRGRLRLTLPSGRVVEVGNGQSGVSAEIHLKSYRPVWASMRRASVGFAASYIDGHWDSPDIAALLRFYLQNRSQLDQASKQLQEAAKRLATFQEVASAELDPKAGVVRVALRAGRDDGSFIPERLIAERFKLHSYKEEEIDIEDVFLTITKGITN